MKAWATTKRAVLGGLLLGCVSGCATKEIWSTAALDNFHEPACPNQLVVYHAPEQNDFLVEYDDLTPSKDRPVRRAYFLNKNALATSRGKKPRFVRAKAAPKGASLPLISATNEVGNSVAQSSTYVVLENHQRFAIYQKGQKLIGEYDLPTYPTSAGPVKRVLLTPITLALDATVVGGWAFYHLAPEILASAQFAR